MKFLVLLWAVFLTFAFTTSTNETYNLINSTNFAKRGCESSCGDLIVPYPFGIISDSLNCSMGEEFDIYCDKSFNPPKPYFRKGGYISIKNISDSTLRISNRVSENCTSRNVSSYYPPQHTFSQENKFTLVGCDSYAWLISSANDISSGCMVFCSKPENVVDDECSGNGCCQSPIPHNLTFYQPAVGYLANASNPTDVMGADTCAYAFIGETGAFKFNGRTDLATNGVNATSIIERIDSTVPVVLDWAIGNMSCVEAKQAHDYACKSNTLCVNSTRESGGYHCECKEGYQGNPYLSPGCEDIDECISPEKYGCYGTCVNTKGSYTCKCKEGYSGNATIQDGCRRKPFNVLHLSLGLGFGFLTLLIGLLVLYLMVKQRKLIRLREKFFEQNGGVLLEHKLKTTGHSVMKIFQLEEIKKATNNYAEDNILGRGGNGTVYKGTLPDTRIVAVKKSQRLDQGQRDQFVNEIVILAQIHHKNVVQLLGCCLETDVPMLAYEFVSNGTLYDHIHSTKSGKGRLTWASRLRIAHESASALAYLHTDTRMSIIHRDVKSTNILLDDNYTAKVADFGASRLVPLGHDQVTTLVQGTIGYLDPEYFLTGLLTGKSDVYSFGVVLAELLTGKRPIDKERGLEDSNLATYFLNAKKENRLLEILDPHVVKEAPDEQLKSACDLVCRCLYQVGENRPSMKDVAIKLETLKKSSKQHPWISQDNYTETSSLMIESEAHDLYTGPLLANSDTFGAYSSSNAGMKEIMFGIQSPR